MPPFQSLQNRCDGAIEDLISSYHDLNSQKIDELKEEPSPLEFMRYVAKNRPFVVRRGAWDWKAYNKWNADYMRRTVGDQRVNVAITPHGNADSVIETQDDECIFVKPHYTEEPFTRVLDAIQRQELDPDFEGPTRYSQTQDDNLRNEYSCLYSDVPKDVPFARIALEKSPDAVNFWLGNSKSTTALHKDNYENIYVQICGQKHFVLLPPVESACVNEQDLPAATYVPRKCAEASEAGSDPSQNGEMEADGDLDELIDLVIQMDTPTATIPFAVWDPDDPHTRATRFSILSRPMRVTLNEGDMLYLPALWYHKVSQSCNNEGICCAVNYWYDMDFSGGFYPMCSFARNVGLLSLWGNFKISDV